MLQNQLQARPPPSSHMFDTKSRYQPTNQAVLSNISNLATNFQTALKQKSQGQSDLYEKLIVNFKKLQPQQLPLAFKALSQSTNVMNKDDHEQFIQLLLNQRDGMVFLQNNADIINSYSDLVVSVFTACPKYFENFLTMMITMLAPMNDDQIIGLKRLLNLADNQIIPPNVLQQLEETKFTNVHSILQHLAVRQSALYQKSIVTVIGGVYPHQSRPLRFHKYFVFNVLKLIQYTPDRFFSPIFRLIVDRLIIMDSEVKPQEEDDEEDDDDTQLQLFDLEMDSVMRNGDEHTRQLLVAEKLDTVMMTLFSYVKECSTDITKLTRIFDTMMQMFSSFVCNTYQLHSIQFLMFYICSFNNKFVIRFTKFLLHKVLDKSLHADVRKCCAAYVSGFVSRANYISPELIVESLEQQLLWLDDYVRTFEQTLNQGYLDVHTHSIFYSICQGVFYVLCYKIHQIMHNEKARAFLSHEAFARLVYSKFNPLRIIAIDIVHEVTNAFKQYFLHDFEQVVIDNRDVVVSKSKASFLENNFFPFDPYLLRQSQVFVTPLYQKWEGRDDLNFNNIQTRARSRSMRSTGGASSSDEGTAFDEEGGMDPFSFEEDFVGSHSYNKNVTNDRAEIFFNASHGRRRATSMSATLKDAMSDDDDDHMNNEEEEEESDSGDEQIQDEDVSSSDEGDNDVYDEDIDGISIAIPRMIGTPSKSISRRKKSVAVSPGSYELQHPYGWPNM